jgi:hypothetical protein
MRRPGKNGSNEQHRLPWKGNACALDSDKDKDSPIAIGGEQKQEIMWMNMHHCILLPYFSLAKGLFLH